MPLTACSLEGFYTQTAKSLWDTSLCDAPTLCLSALSGDLLFQEHGGGGFVGVLKLSRLCEVGERAQRMWI